MATKPVPTLDGNRRLLDKFLPERLQPTALAEFIRDTIGTALRASGGATVVINDDTDTITLGAPTGGSSSGSSTPVTVTVETDLNRPNVMLLRVSDGTGSSSTLPGAPGQPTITAA